MSVACIYANKVNGITVDITSLLMELEHTTIRWLSKNDKHPGNELADWLAKSATKHCSGPEPGIPIQKNELKTHFIKHAQRCWQKTWDRGTDCFNTRSLIPTVSTKTNLELLRLGSRRITEVTQFITGHGLWAYHLGHWVDINVNCKLCKEEEETPYHLWFNCKVIQSLKLYDENKSIIYNICSLLDTEEVRGIIKANIEILEEREVQLV